REPDPGAVLDAGGDVHPVLLELAHPPLAMAGGARLLDHGGGGAAGVARARDREQPLALGLHAATMADGADDGLGARLRAGAAAGRAGRVGGDRDRHLGAVDRLLEAQADRGLEVVAALRGRPRARAAPAAGVE